MSDERPRFHWRRLGRELRQLREFSGLTQRGMGTALGVSQTTVDRIEKAGPKGRPPAWPKVLKWAQQCSDAEPDLAELREMTEAALDEHFLYHNLMDDGLASVQEEIRAEEATAHTMRNFSPWGIPGLLQTPDYARRILALSDYRGKGGIDQGVEARLRRQAILRDESHQLEFVVTEDGLRWRPGPAPMLAAQLVHLAAAVIQPAVTFSVIPSGVLAHVLPLSGFVIHEDLEGDEDPWVAVELYHRRVRTAKPDEVGIYRAQYDILRWSAIGGDEAVVFVHEVARSLT